MGRGVNEIIKNYLIHSTELKKKIKKEKIDIPNQI